MVIRIFSSSPFSVVLVILLSVGQISTEKLLSSTPKTVVVQTNNSSEIEGSAYGPHGRLADVEVNGSGYPTDDEDGDDVHGSGTPPSPITSNVKPTQPFGTTMKPNAATTQASPKTEIVKPKGGSITKEIKIGDENDENEDEDDDEDEDYSDEDDEDFADENINNDDELSTTAMTIPYVVSTTTTQRSFVTQATVPPNAKPFPTTTSSSGPFSPFHETMTNGFYAAIAGGVLVAVITAILLVLFVVFRIRKKDEGSYALDEPKQTRPYATYAYTKASTKEFYA